MVKKIKDAGPGDDNRKEAGPADPYAKAKANGWNEEQIKKITDAAPVGFKRPVKNQREPTKNGRVTIPVQLKDPEIGFLLVKERSKEPLEKEWQKKLYSTKDEVFPKHIKSGGNYGISSRTGKICIVDADTKEVQDVLEGFFETFRYSTGKEGHYQYVFSTDEVMQNIPLKDGAYVKGLGGYAVGPGSVHPNGRQYGLDIRDVPIAHVKKADLLKVLDKFILSKQRKNEKKSVKADVHEISGEKHNKALDGLQEVWIKSDGTRHNLTLGIIGYFKKQGWPEVAIQELIDSLVERTGKGDEHRGQVSSAYPHEGNEYGFPTIKNIADELDCKINEIGEERVDPVLRGLKILAGLDDDHASERNGEGFNKTDSNLGHLLAGKESLTKDEFKEAKNMLKKYKNQLPADLYVQIINAKYFSETENGEGKEMPDMTGWLPFSYTNGNPTAWAGWMDGLPFIRQQRGYDDDIQINDKKITVKEYDGKPIEDKILRVKSDDGKDMIEFDGEIFEKPDFVAKMVYPPNANNFTECLNALPVSDKVLKGPFFFIENDYLIFPSDFYANRSSSYSKALRDNMKIAPVDKDVYGEGLKLLEKYPKQLTLRYACIGANIINVLKINDFPITLKAIGKPDTGKSFAIRFSLNTDYGISDAMLNGDAMNSAFRHHSIADATNLPVYIEEGMLKDKSKLKSFAKNLRGKADQSLTIYGVHTTFVLSMNTDEDIEDPVEKKAIEKRILEFRFDDVDMVPESERVKGDEYREKVKDIGGGLLFEKLKEKTVTEIKRKYFQLLKDCKRDFRMITAKLGAWILDGDENFEPALSKVETPTIKEAFIDKIVSAHRRIVRMRGISRDEDFRSTSEDKQLNDEVEVDEEKKGEFKITVTGFNYIRRQLGIKLDAKKFAEAYNFDYGNSSINGQKGKIIKGRLPKEYLENKNKGELDRLLE